MSELTPEIPFHRTSVEIEMKASRFRGCHENALTQSFEMSPHLIVWSFQTAASPSPDPIQRMAIKSLGMEAAEYQVGAHFEALDKGILVAALKLTGYFFPISISPKVRCMTFPHFFVPLPRHTIGCLNLASKFSKF